MTDPTATQSDPKTAQRVLWVALIPALNELKEQYVADLRAGGYAPNSTSTAGHEIDYFLRWMAGERKTRP